MAKTETSRTTGATSVASRLRPEDEVTRASTAKNDGPLLKGGLKTWLTELEREKEK